MKRFLKILKWILTVFIVVILLFFTIRVVIREKIRYDHRIVTENGIDEFVVTNIGGIEQCLYIRGNDRSNPIILFLHGGPGSPMTPFIYKYQDELENNHVVVNWDQRNSGKTYILNEGQGATENITVDILVEDVKEIVTYLSERFNRDNVVIMGHSWGTVLGTLFVQKYPELVSSYISVGPVVQAVAGDRLSYETTLQAASNAGNIKDYETLSNLTGYLINDDAFSFDSFSKFRSLSNKYLSAGRKDKSVIYALFSPYYNINDLRYYLINTYILHKPLMDYLANEFDVRNLTTEYKVPVYYILGEDDWVTPSIMAQDYFKSINAPDKKLIMIKDAGHIMMIDNTKDFCDAVLSVLK